MIYILKHFDIPLIRFCLENEPLRGAVCRILWQNGEKVLLYPIGLHLTGEGMVSWLRSRTIPRNRDYVQALLASMQLKENDLIGILNVCMGLSLNDCYWVVPQDFSGCFADYNLYDHEFRKAISLLAYTGYGSVRVKGFTSSPEFTTNGMLRKGWRRIGGKILLYKGGTEGASNSGNEPFCEFYAAQIAEKMELNYVPYHLASWKKSVCCVCALFTGKKVSYVPIWRFGEFRNILDVTDYLKKLGQAFYDDFVDMMVFDALIYNTDRHQGNFGLLVDNKTNRPMALAPIFDNGLGLMPYAVAENLDELKEYANTLSSAFDVSFDEIAEAYMTERQRKKLMKLLQFSFAPHREMKHHTFSRKRVKLLEAFVRDRARELLKL